jgi:hypothetical protein
VQASRSIAGRREVDFRDQIRRLSLHRRKAWAGGHAILTTQELNRRFSSVVEALASLGGDFVLDGDLSPWIYKVGLDSTFCKAIFRKIFRFLFTP